MLVLFLPVTALADTIAQRVDAPDTWQGEFQSSTGRSHIYVDMTVEMPVADAFPIYSVKPRTFSIQEVTQLADIMLGEGNWYVADAWDDALVGAEPGYIRNEIDSGEDFTCRLRRIDGIPACVDAHYATLDVLPGWYMFNQLTFALREENTGRDIGTVDEALALANGLIRQISPDMALESVDPEMDGYEMSYRTIYPGQRGDYGYRFHYARMVDSIPITHVNQGGASDVLDIKNPIYSPVLPYEHLFVDVGENGIFQFQWEHPIEITGITVEDCELLPFKQIMDIFATIAPLTIQSVEYYENNALYINRAVLGYMCLMERGQPGSYQLVPVWDFFGARTMNDARFEDRNWSYLTINAIDGTIIDRNYGY